MIFLVQVIAVADPEGFSTVSMETPFESLLLSALSRGRRLLKNIH